MKVQTLGQLIRMAKQHQIETKKWNGQEFYALYEMPDGTYELRAPTDEDMQRAKDAHFQSLGED